MEVFFITQKQSKTESEEMKMEISMNNANYNANAYQVLSQEEIQELLAEIIGTHKATDVATESENIIQFPVQTGTETEPTELQVVPWVNDRNAALNHKREIIKLNQQREIMQRNCKAERYIQRCKAKEILGYFVGGLSACVCIIATYFLLWML